MIGARAARRTVGTLSGRVQFDRVPWGSWSLVIASIGLTLHGVSAKDVGGGEEKAVAAPATSVTEASGAPVEIHTQLAYPLSPKKPVTDTYHGVKVTEDYRWLENWDDPKVKEWSEAQNRVARDYLDALPSVPSLRTRLEQLEASTSSDYTSLTYRAGSIFAIKRQPPKEQPYLVRLASPDDPSTEKVIVDPNTLDPKGGTSINFYVPSRDGRRVAVILSEGGSEDGTLYIYDTATGQRLPDAIPRVNYGTAGGSVAWNGDGSSLLYTRYPGKGERSGRDSFFFQQVWSHKIGTSTSRDRYSIGKEFPRIAEVHLESSEDGRHVLASVANGDGGDFTHYLLPLGGSWKKLAGLSDRIVKAKFGPDGALYLLSRKDTPRGKLLRLGLPGPPDLARADVIVPESEASIQDFEPAMESVFVVDMLGGPNRIHAYDLVPLHRIPDAAAPPPLIPQERSAGADTIPPEGGAGGFARGASDRPSLTKSAPELGYVPTAPVSSVNEILHLQGDEILFRSQTFIDPPSWSRFIRGHQGAVRTALKRTSPADYSDTEVLRETVESTGGARVPLNIVRLKGTKLDGSNPTILSGYGGYGITLSPRFSESRRAWIEQGGVYVIANLRGGGEFGDEWHRAGNLTQKQAVFDDFAAAAKYLVQAGYTTPDKIAIEGGSNGGLLMGAALTQHPELYRAVVSHVGIYDMLRVELSPNGEFNTTEFGTVKDPAQFQALYAYSPYHHVTDGTRYPAVLFMTGANDPRVDPANSRKMTARLQAASASGRPVLLRTSATSGHGIGSALSEEIAEHVDALAFIMDQLHLTYHPVAPPKAARAGGS